MPVEPAESEGSDRTRQGALRSSALLARGAAADLGETPEIAEGTCSVFDCFLAASKA